MSEILNLDDLDVGGKPPFEFQFDGETYQCSSIESFDARTFARLRDEADRDPMAMLQTMLDEEQVQRLYDTDAVFTLRHMNAVFEAWMEHHELDLGKSGGSAKSPKTKKPAKR